MTLLKLPCSSFHTHRESNVWFTKSFAECHHSVPTRFLNSCLQIDEDVPHVLAFQRLVLDKVDRIVSCFWFVEEEIHSLWLCRDRKGLHDAPPFGPVGESDVVDSLQRLVQQHERECRVAIARLVAQDVHSVWHRRQRKRDDHLVAFAPASLQLVVLEHELSLLRVFLFADDVGDLVSSLLRLVKQEMQRITSNVGPPLADVRDKEDEKRGREKRQADPKQCLGVGATQNQEHSDNTPNTGVEWQCTEMPAAAAHHARK